MRNNALCRSPRLQAQPQSTKELTKKSSFQVYLLLGRINFIRKPRGVQEGAPWQHVVPNTVRNMAIFMKAEPCSGIRAYCLSLTFHK